MLMEKRAVNARRKDRARARSGLLAAAYHGRRGREKSQAHFPFAAEILSLLSLSLSGKSEEHPIFSIRND